MTLRLVGAGLPRTGTSSLREALHLLLAAPVHHMSEVFRHPEQAPAWVAAMDGRPPVWHAFLAEYAAAVDFPAANCWRDLAATYPDALVLLSTRISAKAWHRSMTATVVPRTAEILARPPDDPMVPLFRTIFRDLFATPDDPGDPADLMAAYERWNAAVRAEVPADRLVEWQPGDGWEPLCRALDVPVPDTPFPHENSTADYLARAEARAGRDDLRSIRFAADAPPRQ